MSRLWNTFNLKTTHGRANVVKATCATLGLVYLAHRVRNSKSGKLFEIPFNLPNSRKPIEKPALMPAPTPAFATNVTATHEKQDNEDGCITIPLHENSAANRKSDGGTAADNASKGQPVLTTPEVSQTQPPNPELIQAVPPIASAPESPTQSPPTSTVETDVSTDQEDKP